MKKFDRELLDRATNKFNRYVAEENSWLSKQLADLTKFQKSDFIKSFGSNKDSLAQR